MMMNAAGFRRLTTAAGLAGALLFSSTALAAPQIEKSMKVAPGLYELVFNSADGDVYVASTGSRGGAETAKIVRIDGATLAAEGSIDVRTNPAYGLGINTRTQTIYGTDTRGGAVIAVNLKDGKVTPIKQGERAHLREVIVDEAANKAYATMVGGGEGRGDGPKPPSEIWVINGATNTIERTISLPDTQLLGIALDTAGQRIFGTALAQKQIVVVDLKTDKVVQRWDAGGERPTNLVYDAAGKRIFVANQGGTLSVLNATTGALIKSVATGEGALSLAYNPSLKQVYVANRQAGTLSIVDSTSYAVLANLPVGTLPQTVAIDQKTNRIYVTNKARGVPRNAPSGTPPVEDPNGDTVTLVRP